MSADSDVSNRPRSESHSGGGVSQSVGLLAPIVAAAAQQQFAFVFLTWACSRHLHILMHVPTIFAVLAVAGISLWAWRRLERVGVRAAGDERSADARGRFMAIATLVLCGFAVLWIVAQWLPVAFLQPCER